MIKRNEYLEKLAGGYLFPEINKRKQQFLKNNPEAQLISLGVGDTTEPIPSSIIEEIISFSKELGTEDGYVGYGPEQGIKPLRDSIVKTFYDGLVSSGEVFISDGAKCDIGRLQALFGKNISVAIQDPAYPVYVDGCIIQGIDSIHKMSCLSENEFFPDLNTLSNVDLIYICSPNNPTGVVFTHDQLSELVFYAKKNHSLIIFDSAYAAFIRDPNLPKSIYEIEGAEEVAIETSSFSKLAGFTGIRLGWTVVPKALKYKNGFMVRDDWNRIVSTLFNGASIIAQHGGLAALQDKGLKEIKILIDFYMKNACLLKIALEELGYEVFGGNNAPYLWVHFPGKKSWDTFQKILEKAHIITTPGSGFGKAGEGFIRFSAFGKRKNILTAIKRLKKLNDI